VKEDEIFEKVSKNQAAAQLYGLGAPWTNDNHRHFKRGKICGEGSPCLLPNDRFGFCLFCFFLQLVIICYYLLHIIYVFRTVHC
jgi:hypothetical protein